MIISNIGCGIITSSRQAYSISICSLNQVWPGFFRHFLPNLGYSFASAPYIVTPIVTLIVTPTETPIVTPIVTPIETPIVTPIVTPLVTPIMTHVETPIATHVATHFCDSLS